MSSVKIFYNVYVCAFNGLHWSQSFVEQGFPVSEMLLEIPRFSLLVTHICFMGGCSHDALCGDPCLVYSWIFWDTKNVLTVFEILVLLIINGMTFWPLTRGFQYNGQITITRIYLRFATSLWPKSQILMLWKNTERDAFSMTVVKNWHWVPWIHVFIGFWRHHRVIKCMCK